jgi:hypothetical protein
MLTIVTEPVLSSTLLVVGSKVLSLIDVLCGFQQFVGDARTRSQSFT